MSKEDLIFRFRERAAIRQFEANQTHYLAGFQSANELRKELAAKDPPEKLPVEILQEVNGDLRQKEMFEGGGYE